MLDDVYGAIYEDARGRETTRIHNDGRELRVLLRGIAFVGDDFDGLSPVPDQLDVARSKFRLQHDALCACRLEWVMPIPLSHHGEPVEETLAVYLVIGNPLPNGAIDSQTVTLELTTPGKIVRSSGTSGWFEDELLELTKALGDDTLIRACITCAFSDYSPYGHGSFGCLACFRDAKEEYLRGKGKAGIFAVWNRMTEFVQETYLCGEYRLRIPGTGYRG
jgi:hypothetical protein